MTENNIGTNNNGKQNLGDGNWGSQNCGNRNRGDQNFGYRNNGDQNWGDQNWGDRNFGNWNFGDQNFGDLNNGDQNCGNQNRGDWNFGDGNWGDLNNGYRNNGSYNKGDQLYGYFNTGKPEFRFFNKPFDEGKLDEVKFPKWLDYEVKPVNMTWVERDKITEEQKRQYTSSEITGGFLLVETIDDWEKSNKEAALKAWNETTEDDRQLTLQLPNFDADIFFDIFGIDVRSNIKTESEERFITIDGETYKLIKV